MPFVETEFWELTFVKIYGKVAQPLHVFWIDHYVYIDQSSYYVTYIQVFLLPFPVPQTRTQNQSSTD